MDESSSIHVSLCSFHDVQHGVRLTVSVFDFATCTEQCSLNSLLISVVVCWVDIIFATCTEQCSLNSLLISVVVCLVMTSHNVAGNDHSLNSSVLSKPEVFIINFILLSVMCCLYPCSYSCSNVQRSLIMPDVVLSNSEFRKTLCLKRHAYLYSRVLFILVQCLQHFYIVIIICIFFSLHNIFSSL